MIQTGLDRLLGDPARLSARLSGRRFALLAHGASLTDDLRPAHLALAAAGFPPAALFGPEHGYYGVEQDMVPAGGGRDPLTAARLASLYGESEASLHPAPGAFDGLDLLVIDLQDIGARYYTYAATAFWAAEAARAGGCEVWVLDRPNPLGGTAVEGGTVEEGFDSFVGAFAVPVRHGLTLGELILLEARRRGWSDPPEVWKLEGWSRSDLWPATGRPWIAPSPNMPTFETALIYPGGCLIEATVLSEGRGTTRPFQLVGAPGVDPARLAVELCVREIVGLSFIPTFFKPQFQKHAGEICGGVEVVVTDPAALASYRAGIELLLAFGRAVPGGLEWRSDPYEFVTDRPAIDLLTGSEDFRRRWESEDEIGDWIESWSRVEEAFRAERREILLYPDPDRPDASRP